MAEPITWRNISANVQSSARGMAAGVNTTIESVKGVARGLQGIADQKKQEFNETSSLNATNLLNQIKEANKGKTSLTSEEIQAMPDFANLNKKDQIAVNRALSNQDDAIFNFGKQQDERDAYEQTQNERGAVGSVNEAIAANQFTKASEILDGDQTLSASTRARLYDAIEKNKRSDVIQDEKVDAITRQQKSRKAIQDGARHNDDVFERNSQRMSLLNDGKPAGFYVINDDGTVGINPEISASLPPTERMNALREGQQRAEELGSSELGGFERHKTPEQLIADFRQKQRSYGVTGAEYEQNVKFFEELINDHNRLSDESKALFDKSANVIDEKIDTEVATTKLDYDIMNARRQLGKPSFPGQGNLRQQLDWVSKNVTTDVDGFNMLKDDLDRAGALSMLMDVEGNPIVQKATAEERMTALISIMENDNSLDADGNDFWDSANGQDVYLERLSQLITGRPVYSEKSYEEAKSTYEKVRDGAAKRAHSEKRDLMKKLKKQSGIAYERDSVKNFLNRSNTKRPDTVRLLKQANKGL